MAPPIFRNDQHQEQFDRDGYVKVNLLMPEDISRLETLYAEYFPSAPKAFFSSSYLEDYEFKMKISRHLSEVLSERLDTVFKDYRLIGSAFLSKHPGKESEMPMHQDWTIVDETKYTAINIWSPLVDSDLVNGTIEVLPGSHRFSPAFRAPTLPNFFEGQQEIFRPALRPVPTKATESVILNQAVIHYSKPNLSGRMRIAVTTGIVSKEAPLIFHYFDGKSENTVERITQEDDFLLRFSDFHTSIFKRPEMGTSLGSMPYIIPRLTADEARKLVADKLPPQKKEKGLFRKLYSWMER